MSETYPILIHLGEKLNHVIVGQSQLIQQLLVGLLSGGHIILEGVPGTGKTLLVKVLAQLIQADFHRVQLTPDVLPSDITGTNIFDLNNRNFTLKKGPVFTEVLLADEINRTPPKTQAALLEAMEEMQVTLDGESLPLPDLFWVIATQNPLEFEGTYPLPEAQLDRFLFKLVVDYPDQTAEKQMLLNRQAGFAARRSDINSLQPIATVTDILEARQAVKAVKVSESIIDYLLALVRTSRQYPDLALGASPRAAGAWLQTSQAVAWLEGRDFVTPDDIKAVASPLLRHRLILKPEAMLDGLQMDAVIAAVVNQVAVPR
ncbi:AAA family ATPase [Anabaena sp. FACHB-709]|uniref:ATPase associated with various cellular activities n=2 Tax=Nostocaceae TaxID=1162 RepID=A0A1Z4KNV9_ANAVA|nr:MULTISPECIES: MoxR family ATPase [Nostocaceae]BAY70638.1 ATPase associated with various cellular activities [Trichormus variabilis NIES-23]HBW31869.1 MoxR family ATPase [Nostoc sp. UBA8866]MBD2172603.1 MoxR family ATPase [Anabaena cylindrica FACHB-318]MBD2264425.1 MoxR family ATPase [Anabaena sp. FACHB-709]MBD2274196.1 MoxR family ATPase [Nostoc sp. PCC 7120 = FACHB-418]